MQKVIIDTNVIVSALIQKNYPFLIINELFLENKIKICLSRELMQEYFDVLFRPKFQKFPDFIITGNTNDFTISNYKNTKILTPREYWVNFRPE